MNRLLFFVLKSYEWELMIHIAEYVIICLDQSLYKSHEDLTLKCVGYIYHVVNLVFLLMFSTFVVINCLQHTL